MTRVRLPRLQEPISDAAGRVSRSWFQALRDMQQAIENPSRIGLVALNDSSSSSGTLTFAKSSDWSAWAEDTDYQITTGRGIEYSPAGGTFEVGRSATYLIFASLACIPTASSFATFLLKRGSANIVQQTPLSPAASRHFPVVSQVLVSLEAGDQITATVSPGSGSLTIGEGSSLAIYEMAGAA